MLYAVLMAQSDPTKDELLQKAIAGDQEAFAALFEQYSARLKRMIVLRMDARIKGRLDASDVLQEAFIDASQQLPN